MGEVEVTRNDEQKGEMEGELGGETDVMVCPPRIPEAFSPVR